MDDVMVLDRSWRKETVGQCARRALKLMTGRKFESKADFEEWWKVNSGGRNCLWYWQQRLKREFDEADIATSSYHINWRPYETWEQYSSRIHAIRATARTEVLATVTAELRQLDPEVEAKVRLLTVCTHTGCYGAQFWPDPPNLRISSGRLLDLLDRKDLWPDVPWDSNWYYSRLAERLGMWADVLFTSSDVPRLKAVLEREHDNLGASLIIGISRLLPVAAEEELGSTDTRDGWLRHATLNERDLFVRCYCAMELVRVGLPENAAFLTEMAFAAHEDDSENCFMQYVLQALAQPPLTAEKRRFLVDLLLDQRFEPLWTCPDGRGGDSPHMCRVYGIQAINAHAGRELVGDAVENGLTNPDKYKEALAELRRLIAQLRDAKRTDTPDEHKTVIP